MFVCLWVTAEPIFSVKLLIDPGKVYTYFGKGCLKNNNHRAITPNKIPPPPPATNHFSL